MKGIIFDFNGTLLWDSELHCDAWRLFSERLRGYPFSDEEMREYMFGRTNKDIITYCLGEVPDDNMVTELANEKESLYRRQCLENRSEFKLAKGAVELLDWLTANNIPRTIATMSEWQNVEFYINEFNLGQWFDIDKIVYSNGKIKGKPSPEIYEIAAANIGLEPQNCVVIEDAVSGLQSAYNAKIGNIIAIASMLKPEFYKKFSFISQIITDFNELNKNELFEIQDKQNNLFHT